MTTISREPTIDRVPADPGPRRPVMLAAAIAYALLFVTLFALGGESLGRDLTGAQILDQYDASKNLVLVGAFGSVVVAAVLVFYGAMLKAGLNANGRHWAADVAFGGTVAMGITLVGFAVTTLAMRDAVATGNADVAQTVNILDNTNFVPAMLGLVCTMAGAGVAAWVTGALPRWLSAVSIVLGLMAPLGPGGFLPFVLYPVWLIVVAALIRRSSGDSAAVGQVRAA